MSDERIEEIFTDGRALAVARRDVREQVRLLYGIELHRMLGGSPREAIPLLEESLALADAAGDPELRQATLQPFGLALFLLGDLEGSIRMIARQISLRKSGSSSRR